MLKFFLSENAVERIFSICSVNRDVEDGGRLIGKKIGNLIFIYEVLPSGPQAQKNYASLYQDGTWQLQLFRHIEKIDFDLDFVGSFHHHLPFGGMPYLSSGDIETYQRLLSYEDFRFPFFLSVLVHSLPQDFKDFCISLENYVTVNAIYPNSVENAEIKIISLSEKEERENIGRITQTINDFSNSEQPWYLYRPATQLLKILSNNGYAITQGKHYIKINSSNHCLYLLEEYRDKVFCKYTEELSQVADFSEYTSTQQIYEALNDFL